MVKKIIFLLVLNFFLVFALAIASQSQYYPDLGNITSDLSSYSCWPNGCIAYVNLTVNPAGAYSGNLSNLSLNNTAEAAGITYKIYWLNASSAWENQSDGNTWVNGSVNNYNLTGTIQFKMNITLPNALSAKWNVSFNVGGTTYELTPYLDSINLTSPVTYNLTTSQTPGFNFTLYSHNSTIQACTLYLNVNNTGTWTSYGSNSSVINGSLTRITASSLSDGNYTWKITCNETGDSGSRWIYIADRTAPVISSIDEVTASTTATISWETGDSTSNSNINYGETYSLGTLSSNDSGASPSIELTDLNDAATYYYNLTSCDAHGNCDREAGTFQTSAYTAPTSGSSGTAPSTSKSKTFTIISAGDTGTWVVNDRNLGISQINLTVTNASSNVKLTASKYSTLPSQVSVAKSGKVYKYLKIEATNLGTKLNLANILLQVEKTWAENNSVTKQAISLYKFDNISEEWKKITTVSESEDATYYYLNAELTSFSYFAIAGDATTQTTTADTSSSSSANTTPAANTSTNASAEGEQTDAEKEPSRLWIIILIVVIGIIALVVVGFIVYTQLIKKQKLAGLR